MTRRLIITLVLLALLPTLVRPAAAHPLIVIDAELIVASDAVSIHVPPLGEHLLGHLAAPDSDTLADRLAAAIRVRTERGDALQWRAAPAHSGGITLRLETDPAPGTRATRFLTLALDPSRPLAPARHQIQLRVSAPSAPPRRILRLTSDSNTEWIDLRSLRTTDCPCPHLSADAFGRPLLLVETTPSATRIELHVPLALLEAPAPFPRAEPERVSAADVDAARESLLLWAERHVRLSIDGVAIAPAGSTVALLAPGMSAASDAREADPSRPISVALARLAFILTDPRLDRAPITTIELVDLPANIQSIDGLGLCPGAPDHPALLTRTDNRAIVRRDVTVRPTVQIGRAASP